MKHLPSSVLTTIIMASLCGCNAYATLESYQGEDGEPVWLDPADEPIEEDPTPVDPTDPRPTDPTPMDPSPMDPNDDPTPLPEDPTPMDPAPVDPAPTSPTATCPPNESAVGGNVGDIVANFGGKSCTTDQPVTTRTMCGQPAIFAVNSFTCGICVNWARNTLNNIESAGIKTYLAVENKADCGRAVSQLGLSANVEVVYDTNWIQFAQSSSSRRAGGGYAFVLTENNEIAAYDKYMSVSEVQGSL